MGLELLNKAPGPAEQVIIVQVEPQRDPVEVADTWAQLLIRAQRPTRPLPPASAGALPYRVSGCRGAPPSSSGPSSEEAPWCPRADRQRPTDCGRSGDRTDPSSSPRTRDPAPAGRPWDATTMTDAVVGFRQGVGWLCPGLLGIVTYGLVDRHQFAYPL